MALAKIDHALRAEVEEFFYAEADLLDSWRLDEWAELFTEDAIMHVPALDDPERSPKDSVFLVADDIVRIRSRVRQLMGDTAWAENPPSRTRHLVTNVRVVDIVGDAIYATANFLVHRSRMERISTFVGQYRYKLIRTGESFKIAERKVILAQETLRPQGIMSIIV